MGSELLSGTFSRDGQLRSLTATLGLTRATRGRQDQKQYVDTFPHHIGFLFVARPALFSLGTIDLIIAIFERCPAHVALNALPISMSKMSCIKRSRIPDAPGMFSNAPFRFSKGGRGSDQMMGTCSTHVAKDHGQQTRPPGPGSCFLVWLCFSVWSQ